jgi:hypothetical protein
VKRRRNARADGAIRWLRQRRQWFLVAERCWGFGYWRDWRRR